MESSIEWAEIRCRSLDEAIWFRAALEAAGLESVIPDEHTLGLPLESDAEPGSVRLLVRADGLERALEVLAAHPVPGR